MPNSQNKHYIIETVILSTNDLDNDTDLREMMKAVKTSGNCKNKIRLTPSISSTSSIPLRSSIYRPSVNSN